MNDNKGFACIGILAGYGISMIIFAIWGGFVFAKLWEWFIVSIFQLPLLTLVQAIGLASVISFATKAQIATKSTDDIFEQWFAQTFLAIFYPLAYLFIGWIITWFL